MRTLPENVKNGYPEQKGFQKKLPKAYMIAAGALYGANGTEGVTLPIPTKKSRKRALIGPEAMEQIRLVNWAHAANLVLISIPNSAKRTPWAGEREKALGLHPGASDLLLIATNGRYGGFFIEMKAPGKKPRPEQYEFLELVRTKGYASGWYDNWLKAAHDVGLYISDRFLNNPL
jgi:hypothetical protein